MNKAQMVSLIINKSSQRAWSVDDREFLMNQSEEFLQGRMAIQKLVTHGGSGSGRRPGSLGPSGDAAHDASVKAHSASVAANQHGSYVKGNAEGSAKHFEAADAHFVAAKANKEAADEARRKGDEIKGRELDSRSESHQNIGHEHMQALKYTGNG